MTLTATIRRNAIGALIAQIGTRSQATVDNAASDVRDRAVQMAPRDTGSLQASLYVSNSAGTSDYSQRAGEARSRNSDAVIIPEVTPEFALTLFGGNTGYSAVVGVSVGHGVFQEFGTRFISARPYLTPAVEGVREAFISAMGHVADV